MKTEIENKTENIREEREADNKTPKSQNTKPKTSEILKEIRKKNMETKQAKQKIAAMFPNKNKKSSNNQLWIFVAIIGIFIAMQFFNSSFKIVDIDEKRFEKMIDNKDVGKVEIINNKKVNIYIKKNKLTKPPYRKELFGDSTGTKVGGTANPLGPHYTFLVVSAENFEKDFKEWQKDFSYKDKVSLVAKEEINWIKELGWLIFPIILIVFFVISSRKMGAGLFSVGKSRAKLFDKEAQVQTNFSDVAGLEEAKVEITEIVDFLKQPDKYTELGGKIPKGVLLIGPPGTGKTLLAKAVAGEAHVPFFSLSGSEFVEMFVGVGASRVRDLFAQAKAKTPCIIFIDEIDAIGRSREQRNAYSSNDERESTLNQLLTEMDGFDTNSGIILLAATNRADILDSALLRAGRFDRQIYIELPDVKEREEIFKVHMKSLKNLSKTINVEFFAKQTPGFSGADIANVCNEAALIAARKENKKIDKQDFLDAIDRIIGGLEKKTKIISPEEKQIIAFHEAGHATVSWFLEYAAPLVKVTIIPRGKALGAAWYLPEERHITTKEQLFDEICTTLAGRAAEDVRFNKISTGALNDLERATKQIYAMVSYFGMSEKIGNISFFDSASRNSFFIEKPYSNKTAETIDEEARKIISEQYIRAKQILIEKTEGHQKLAEILLEKEVIFYEDLEKIFGKRPHEKEKLIEEKPKTKKEKIAKENSEKENNEETENNKN